MMLLRLPLKRLLPALLCAAAICLADDAAGAIFSNSALITIPDAGSPGVANPYPSSITVSGLTGGIARLTVTLQNINHSRPDDIEILLVSPGGAKFVLLSDAGGTTTPASGVTLTFDDTAASAVPDAGPIGSGSVTYRPMCVDFQANINTAFPAPAPAGPYNVPAPRGVATLSNTFNGTNPNGTWNLYVVDDVPTAGQNASIGGGWALNITTGTALQPTTTTLSSSTNPATTGQSLTFTANVRRTSDSAIITLGSVTFREGTNILAGNVALNGSGQASFTTATLSEGAHVITADYGGTAMLAPSSTNLTETLDSPTLVRTNNTFCNTNTLVLPPTGSPGVANVYPSHIFVSGLTGTISRVTLTLSNLAHATPDDFGVLLVGPSGAQFVVMSDVGGSSLINNVTLTLSDFGPAALPDSGPLTSGNFRPTSVNATPAVFPPPAPAGPYNHAAPAGSATFSNLFNGTNPNGTWSLYVVDDVPGVGGVMARGWCLSFLITADAPTTTTVASSGNPSQTGQSVTFTATVSKTNGLPVTVGTVSFREGGTNLQGAVSVNASGQVTLTTTLAEGTHLITADYNGSPGSFNSSSASVTQRVDTATVVSNNRFCNPGAIVMSDTGVPGAIYPSRIRVSGAGPALTGVSVTISNLSHVNPDDIELLLVSPSGAQMVLMSDTGGSTDANHVTFTFSDSASVSIADVGPLTNGTYKPTSVNLTAASFPAPAPPPPYNHPAPAGSATLASVFGGTNPNGYWSLYVLDDIPGNGGAGSIADGWCLTLTTPPAISCASDIVTTNALGQCQSAPVAFSVTGSGLPQPTVICRLGVFPITSPRVFPIGTTIVICTASNGIGASATCSFAVTVNDTQAPAITCPGNMTVTAAGQCPAVVNFTVSATDNCSGATAVASPPSGSTFPPGTNTVNVTATDVAGNTNTCSFKVIVVPGAGPQLRLARANTNVVLSWPSAFTCYRLQSTPRLLLPSSSNVWTFYAGPLVTNAGNIFVTNSASSTDRFFRLSP